MSETNPPQCRAGCKRRLSESSLSPNKRLRHSPLNKESSGDSNATSLYQSKPIYHDEKLTRDYYYSIQSNRHNSDREIKVGDVIALEWSTCASSHTVENFSKPFSVPWIPCQILTIYQEYGMNMIEYKLFYRKNDFDDENPIKSEIKSNEILESDFVDEDYADRILDSITVHECAGDDSQFFCEKYFDSRQNILRMLKAQDRMEKCLIYSINCKKSNELKWKMQEAMGTQYNGFVDSPMEVSGENEARISFPSKPIYDDKQQYYKSVTIRINDLKCTICIGDIVAVHCHKTSSPLPWSNKWHPYSVPWRPCQILAIHKQNENDYVECRYFYRKNEVKIKHNIQVNELVQTNNVNDEDILDVLGPLSIRKAFVHYTKGFLFCNKYFEQEMDELQQATSFWSINILKDSKHCQNHPELLSISEAIVKGSYENISRSIVNDNSVKKEDFGLSKKYLKIENGDAQAINENSTINTIKDDRKQVLSNSLITYMKDMKEHSEDELIVRDTNAKDDQSVMIVSVDGGEPTKCESDNTNKNKEDYQTQTDVSFASKPIDYYYTKINELKSSGDATVKYRNENTEISQDKINSSIRNGDSHDNAQNTESQVKINFPFDPIVSHRNIRYHNRVEAVINEKTHIFSIGDIVAMHCEDSIKPSTSRGKNCWHPYSVPWSPCQILTIYEKCNKTKIEYRWFYRKNDFVDVSLRKEVKKNELVETNYVGNEDIDSLLGHIKIEEESEGGYFCEKGFNVDDEEFEYWEDVDMGGIVRRILDNSIKCQENAKVRTHMEGVVDDITSNMCESTQDDFDEHDVVESDPEVEEDASIDEGKIFIDELPFYVDVSQQRAYYKSLKIISDTKVLMDPYKANQEKSWTCQVGSTVAVHYNYTSKRVLNCKKEFKKPFNMMWAAAEILCIYHNLSSKNEAQRLKTMKKNPRDFTTLTGNDFIVEVRWLYFPRDISSLADEPMPHPHHIPELIETDHVDDISAECLLSLIHLHSTPKPLNPPRPILNFYVERYYSPSRKLFLPHQSLGTLHIRGRRFSRHTSLPSSSQPTTTTTLLPPPSSNNNNLLPLAISRLTLSSASHSAQNRQSHKPLLCREDKHKQIYTFLRSAIISPSASSFFIAGPPGTGKTSSVLGIIAQLREEHIHGELPPFHFVNINGMELGHPVDAYRALWEGMRNGGPVVSAAVAASKLDRYFSSRGRSGDGYEEEEEEEDGGEDDDMNQTRRRRRRRPVTICLLDEVDYLMTKKQTVLYDFFNWPVMQQQQEEGSNTTQHQRSSSLVVIGISNTINLLDRLKKSISSRIGNSKCIFKTYEVGEIEAILKERLGHDCRDCFEEDAIKFASRKAASIQGDIRKAFQICRSAAESVWEESERGDDAETNKRRRRVVTIRDIQKVTQKVFDENLLKYVSTCTSFEALLFVSLGSLGRTSLGRESFGVMELLIKMEGVSSGFGDEKYLPCVNLDELIGMLNRLAEVGLVVMVTSKRPTTVEIAAGCYGGLWPRTLVKMKIEDDLFIHSALKNTAHEKLSEKYLGRSMLMC